MTFKAKRRFILVALLALMTFGVFLPNDNRTTANAAIIMYEKEITYYSDPGMTNVVGYGHIFCNGRGTLEGTSSPYHTEEIVNVCCWGVPC